MQRIVVRDDKVQAHDYPDPGLFPHVQRDSDTVDRVLKTGIWGMNDVRRLGNTVDGGQFVLAAPARLWQRIARNPSV